MMFGSSISPLPSERLALQVAGIDGRLWLCLEMGPERSPLKGFSSGVH